jgi:AcrR family transcriptional regulator
MNTTRTYSMGVRGERAAATRRRIVEAARELFVTQSADFTLDGVATAAGTSVQTVLRAVGTKDRLILETIGSLRDEPPDPIDATLPVGESVSRLFDDYEEIGDRVIRMLAEEHRIPGFAEMARIGRQNHRAWVEASFSRPLALQPAARREQAVLALVAATDVYVWKVLRRDTGLDRTDAESVVARLVRGALANAEGD